MTKKVVVYTYFNSPSSNYNLSYFVQRELCYRNDIDYILVINGYQCDVPIPEFENITILRRENEGYDFGGHAHALQYLNDQKRVYDYYFFMNSGVIGPILPHYIHESHWTNIFIRKITDHVKLVGTTIVCLPHSDLGGYGQKVEGFFFMVDDIGLDLLQKEGTIFCKHPDKTSAIVNGEYGLSNCILKHGYTIDCMLPRYQNMDWKDSKNWNLNNNMHPSRQHSFYGSSINPYDVIFHKWFWHGLPYVNFHIIEQHIHDYCLQK